MGLLSDHTPITPRNAINASFAIEKVGTELRWVFQDVLPGGVADCAGLRPGDVLLSVAGKQLHPATMDVAAPLLKCGAAFHSLSLGEIRLKMFS